MTIGKAATIKMNDVHENKYTFYMDKEGLVQEKMCIFQMMINDQERELLEFNMGECVGMKDVTKLFHFQELGVVLTVLITVEDPMHPIPKSMTFFSLNDKGEVTFEAASPQEVHENLSDDEKKTVHNRVVDGEKPGTCCTIF